MPVSEQRKRQLLEQLGLDPSQFELVEEQQQQAVVPREPQLSRGEAFFETGKRALVPTATGLGGAIAGQTLIPIPGLGAAVGGIAGGLLGQFGQQQALQAFQEPSDFQESQQRLAAAREQFPLTTLAAEVAPSLAAFRPTPSALGRLGEAIRKPLTGTTLTQGERAALQNAVASAGLETGVEGGFQIAEGELNIPRLAGAAAIGGAFTEPTRLGRRFFPQTGQVSTEGEIAPAIGARRQLPAPTGPSRGPIVTPPQEIRGLLEDPTRRIFRTRTTPQGGPQLIGGQRQLPAPLEVPGQRQQPTEELTAAEGGTRRERVPTIGGLTTTRREAGGLIREGALEGGRLGFRKTEEERIAESIPLDQSRERGEGFFGKQFQEQITKSKRKQLRSAQELATAPLRKQKKQTLFQETSTRGFNKPQGLPNEERPGITQRAIEQGTELAEKRGVTIQEDPELRSPTGEPIAGKAQINNLRKRIVSYNPERAGDDTIAHEVGHIYVRDLKNSARRQDQNLYVRGLRAFNGDEEKMVEAVGLRVDDLNKIAGINLRSAQQWLRDVWSNIKLTFGLASDEDLGNLLARRLREDAPFKERPELKRGLENLEAQTNPELRFQKTSPESPAQTGEGPTFADRLTHWFRGTVQRVGENTGPSGKYLQNRFERFLTNYSRNRGRYINIPLRIWEDLPNQSAERLEQISRHLWEMNHFGNSTVQLNSAEQRVIDNYRQHLVDVHADQRAEGIQIIVNGRPRQPKDKPNYYPGTVDTQVTEVLREAPKSAEGKRLKNDYVTFLKEVHGLTEGEANDLFNARQAAANKKDKDDADFAALRRAEGYGIPFSWLEKNPQRLARKYGNRIARDFAFFDAIQNDNVARGILGIPDQFGSKDKNATQLPNGEKIEPVANDATRALLAQVRGDINDLTPPSVQALDRVVRAAFLGTMTGVRDHVSSWIQSLPYMRISDIPKMLQAYGQVRKGFKGAFEQGVVRPQILSIEVGNSAEGFSRMTDRFLRLADFLSTVQGRNAIEKFTRAHNFALGEMLTIANFNRAFAGDQEAVQFLKKFGRQIDNLDEIIAGKQLPSQEVINEFSAAFTERVQGTYDARGLPEWATHGRMAPFFNLARWSIERANIVREDVLNPALREGNYRPLLRYTLGATLGGAMIEQINEVINAKRAQTPTLSEALDQDSIEDALFSEINMLQLAGYGGMLSDIAKIATDIKQGNIPRTYSYPLANFMSESVVDGLRNFSQAVDAGTPVHEATIGLINEVLKDNIQGWRILNNQLLNREEAERSNQFRDLRVFRLLRDLPVSIFVEANPLLNKDIKKFKRTKDFEEAGRILYQDIIPRLRERFENDPTQFQRAVEGLGRMQHATVPRDPLQREQFLDFLGGTQGQDVAQQRVQEKALQDAINQMKSRLVP